MQQPHGTRTSASLGRVAGLAAVAFAFLAAPGLDGQEAEDGERQELTSELQQVNRQLAGIQQRAMQDPELQQEQADTEETVIAAMTELDPEAQEKIDRIEELQGEVRAAQEEGDQQEIGSLLQEQRQLQQSLQQTQARAMRQEDVAASIESFRESLVAAMMEVDPQTEELLERQEELQAELTPPPGS